MANNFTPRITIDGDKELHDLIASLPNRQISAASKSMRQAARQIVKAARANLTKNHGLDTGYLKKSIGVRHLKAIRKESKVVMYIGPRFEFETEVSRVDKRTGRTGKPAKYVPWRIAHLVEFGHKIAVEKESGMSKKGVKLDRKLATGAIVKGTAVEAGFVQGRPFLRPAVDANRTNFLAELKAGFKKEIERRVRKGQVMLNIPAWQGEGKGGDL